MDCFAAGLFEIRNCSIHRHADARAGTAARSLMRRVPAISVFQRIVKSADRLTMQTAETNRIVPFTRKPAPARTSVVEGNTPTGSEPFFDLRRQTL
jgi:hypothetical protein